MGTKLSEKAMLVELHMGWWQARTKDRTVTKEIHSIKDASVDAGLYLKRILGRDHVRPVQAIVVKARHTHYDLTLPWENSGKRILTAACYPEYQRVMANFKTEFEDAVEHLVATLDEKIEEQRLRLGDMFDRRDYPGDDAVRGFHYFDVRVSPVPEAGDFRVELDADEVDSIRTELEARTNDTLNAAMGHVWTRLRDVVAHVSTSLGTADKVFRDTLISNVQHLNELIPQLNVTDDPNLESLRRDVERTLCNLDPKTLRSDDEQRADAAKTASELVDKMSGFMGGF
jgi:hypothetical protein